MKHAQLIQSYYDKKILEILIYRQIAVAELITQTYVLSIK